METVVINNIEYPVSNDKETAWRYLMTYGCVCFNGKTMSQVSESPFKELPKEDKK